MRQLCLAIAGPEDLGLTHGDIRPENMLLDSNWNLKLADIDRATKIGEDVVVMTEPFGRLLSDKDGHGEGAGSYGQAGARMDTFAIGSVLYTLLRGHEPYETEPWGPEHFVILGEKLQNQEFPPLTDSTSDAISRCRNGGYCSVTELLAEFSDGAGKDVAIVEDQQLMELRQLECQNLIKSGIVDELERY